MRFTTLLAVSWLAVLLPIALAQTQATQKVEPASRGQVASGQQSFQQALARTDSARQDYSKQAYVVERWYNRIREENDGTGTREREVEVKVLSEAGVKAFAVLKFSYTSANETVEFDYVRVRKPGVTVVKTPDYNIQDMPADVTRTAPLYSDIHEKHVAVKGLSVGDVLEYLVRVRVTKPEVPGQFWLEYSFGRDGIVKDERLEVNLPLEKQMTVVSPEFKPEMAQEGARRVYRWAHANLEVKEKDPNEIPRRIPPSPDVQITTFTSWEEVGRWYDSLQKDPLQVTPAIQAKADELTRGLKSENEKIHAIYNFVSLKFHYIGLDFGIGRYQPHAADDVLDNGYGDCKDKHTLLASLLKAEGIEAWPALIHTSRKLDAEVPSPAQFNHIITVLPRGGSFLWLDTTPEVAPYGLLLLRLRDKQALVIPTHQPPKLMTTPAQPPEPMRQEFSMEGKLSGEGIFTGHAEVSYRGDAEVLFRMLFRQVPESQWREAAQRISYGMNFIGDVSNVKVLPPDDLDEPFTVSYDYVRKNFGDWDDHHTIAPLPPMGIEVTKDSKEKKPQEPVLLGAVGKVTYRSRMELPAGYEATAPARCHLVEPYAEYDGQTVIEGQIMTTTRAMVIKKSEVLLSEWEGFRQFGRTIADDEYNYIRLNGTDNVTEDTSEAGEKEGDKNPDADDMFREGREALQRSDFRRAQELFEKVIARQPNYKGAHLNLGGVLAAQNRLGDAIAEFHKEEEISPGDPLAYRAAAAASLRGSRDQAIEEWRRLLKVDAKNRTAAMALGGLLYQAGKYPEAIEVLEAAVKEAPESPGLQLSLGQAYLKAGQNEKAIARMRHAVELRGDDPETLNNVAYTLAENNMNLDLAQEYAEKAVDKLDKEIQKAESAHGLRATYHETGLRVTYQLSLTWDTLGWVYFQQGDLKRSESFVRPAWLLGEDTVVAEHLGEIYEKEGRTQQAVRAYEYALAVSPVPAFARPLNLPTNIQIPQPNVDRGLADKIVARYEKLTGKKPTIETRRLPNGEWTQTLAEQLRHSRAVKLANEAKLSGSAQFLVVFKPGTVESAEYESGDDTLEPLAGKLKAAHYPLEFPPGSAASLVVRVQVHCKPAAPCVGSLINPVAPGPQLGGATY